MKPIKMKRARMKTIRLIFWWKEKWKQSHGIMLITTLLILALLVGMTVGFITINRDNLLLATNVKDQEAALQAAYAGVQYAQMGFEEDGGFGTGPGPWSSKHCSSPNNGNGFTEVFCSSNFSSWEGNGVAVGVLNNGNSVFEVIFNNGPNNNNNGYNLSDIAEDPTAPPSTPATFPTNEVSINNLAIGPGGPPPPPGGNSIPSYSARVIVLGYSHGVTRVVEAMFHDVGYVNSSVRSADGINIKAGCPTTAWNISSKDPYYNHIKAGISLQGSSFKQTGGWINGPTSLADTSFSQISGAGNMGNAYALECAYKTCNPSSTTTPILSNGQVSLDQIYPTSSTPPLTSVNTESTTSGTGNGTFYANSDHAGNLSSSSPVSASTMLSVISKEQTAPGPGGGPGSGGGATYYIPAGIWAIESDGKTVDVYSTTGTYLGQFKGSYKDKVNGNTLFSIQNFQIDLSPGYNFVVDNGITSAEVSTSPSSANPQGNLMVTLSPQDFTSSTGNETGGNSVLPTIGLGYNGYNTQGNSPSTLQVAGNLYVQGGIEGNGGVIVPTGASAPSNNNTSLSCSGCNWIPSNPSTTSYSYSQPDWSASWAASVITSSSQSAPPL